MFYWDGHGALPAKFRPRERYRQSTLTRSPQLKSSAAPPASKVGGAAKTPPDRPIARRRLCPFHRFACIEAPFAWRVLSTRIIWRRKKKSEVSFFRYIYKYIYVYTNITIYVVLSIHIHFSGRRTRTAARRQSFVHRGAEGRLFTFLAGHALQRRHTPVFWSFAVSKDGEATAISDCSRAPTNICYPAFAALSIWRIHMIRVF